MAVHWQRNSEKRTFLFTPQISLWINLESWNFSCSHLLTISRGKKSQNEIQGHLTSNSFGQNRGQKIWNFDISWHFRVWWLKMTGIEYRWVIHCQILEFEVNQDVEVVFEAKIVILVTLLFRAWYLCFKSQNAQNII